MSMKPQMSTVLRYQYRNGNTEEIYRYQWGSICSQYVMQAKQVFMEFKCGSKLLAQTYDGAAVMAGEHAGLQAKLAPS
jgi:hypothetical protein